MKKLVFLALVVGWMALGALGPNVTPAQAGPIIPIPSTLPLLGLGIAALFATRSNRD